MTNQELDQVIYDSIRNNIAVDVDDAKTLSNSRERLKRRGLIAYNKEEKRWIIVANVSNDKNDVCATTNENALGSNSQGVEVNDSSNANEKIQQQEQQMNTSVIDQQIAEARQRKQNRAQAEGNTLSGGTRVRLTDEQRAERKIQKEREQQEKLLEREERKRTKQATRAASKKQPHLAKVESARAKLPAMEDKVESFFNELTLNFTAAQLATLSSHLTFFNREKATQRALNQTVAVGQRVKIVSGDPRFIGREGTVVKSQRIRCYVELEGAKRPVYLFTSDVVVVDVESPAAAQSA